MDTLTSLFTMPLSPIISLIPPVIIFYFFIRDGEDYSIAKVMTAVACILFTVVFFQTVITMPSLLLNLTNSSNDTITPAVEDNPYLENITNVTMNATKPAWNNDWLK